VLGGHRLRRHRGHLQLLSAADAGPAGWRVSWKGETTLTLPDGRVLLFDESPGAGVRADLARRSEAVVACRRGGERLRLRVGGPHRTLKNLFQESGVPPWERVRVPLLFLDGHLVHVPGVGTDPDWAAGPDEPGLSLRVVPPVVVPD
jgi:tRNA(Ile)-lysidine synthase